MPLSIASLVLNSNNIGGSSINSLLSEQRSSRTDCYFPPSPATSQRSTARSNSDASSCADAHGPIYCDRHAITLPSISALLASCPEPTPRQSPQMGSLAQGYPYHTPAKLSFPTARAEHAPETARPLYSPKSSPPTAYLSPEPTPSYFGREANSAVERYPCDCCNKSFSRPSSLRIHKHSHTGERPFVCSIAGCQRAFSVRSNMRRHMKVHQLE